MDEFRQSSASQPGIGRRAFLWLALAGTAWLAGCATRPPQPGAAHWPEQRAQRLALDHWRARGRVGVRAGGRGWQAGFDWRQRGANFDIQLSGPFGRGVLALAGDGRGVTLRRPGRPPRRAASASGLLASETGWRLPVEGLRYWLLGVPRPQVRARHRLDAQGRLAELRQDGWHIRYQAYHEGARGPDLPARIELTRDDLRVRILVRDWHLGGP